MLGAAIHTISSLKVHDLHVSTAGLSQQSRLVNQGSPVKDQLPQLPASSYVESIVVALERHPLGSILLILLVGVVAFGVYAWKH